MCEPLNWYSVLGLQAKIQFQNYYKFLVSDWDLILDPLAMSGAEKGRTCLQVDYPRIVGKAPSRECDLLVLNLFIDI